MLQFGGAAGTLASLGEKALVVEQALARELALAVADVPWHAQRDRLVEVAAALGGVTATLGKLARDVILLAQTEVAEAFEPARRRPRRLVDAAAQAQSGRLRGRARRRGARAAPRGDDVLAAVQEHERGLGDWPAEWDTLPALFELAGGSLASMIGVVEGLDVDVARMRANLDVTQGQIMAEAVQMSLAAHVGKAAAHALVAEIGKRATREGRALGAALKADGRVTQWLDAARSTGCSTPSTILGSRARSSTAYWPRASVLSRSEPTMPHADLGHVRINYMVDGPPGAPWLTLSNSLGTDFEMWSPQVPALVQRFRVLRYDTRGHGASSAPARLRSRRLPKT